MPLSSLNDAIVAPSSVAPSSNETNLVELPKGQPNFAVLSPDENPHSLLTRAASHFGDSLALVSSFGADAAVLLHMVTTIKPDISVIFVDTGRHFPETLAYVNELTHLLGLRALHRASPRVEEIARLDPEGERANYDPDGCCDFRKTAPLSEALTPFSAWISGRKRFQAQTREELPLVEKDETHTKINPLANWRAADIEAYRLAHHLPSHPLVAKNYLSIGCAPCTLPVAPGEDLRSGRWRGFSKIECGIHRQNDQNSAQTEILSSVAFPDAAASVKGVKG